MMDIPIADIRQILIGRRDALSDAIGALDRAMGLPVLVTAAAPIVTPVFAAPVPRVVSSLAKPAKKTRRESAGDIGEAILSALKRKSPQSPGELARAVSVSRALLRYRLQPLVHNGAVAVSGTTAGRRVSLASGKPAKEEPRHGPRA